MLLDALCRYDGAEPSMIPAAPSPLEMRGVDRAIELAASVKQQNLQHGLVLRATILDALASANNHAQQERPLDSQSNAVSSGAASRDVTLILEENKGIVDTETSVESNLKDSQMSTTSTSDEVNEWTKLDPWTISLRFQIVHEHYLKIAQCKQGNPTGFVHI